MTVGTGPVTPPGNSTLSFGVSNTQDGTFQNDAGSGITPGDPRIVNVAAGDTFYAQVTYSGPAPVTGVTIYLANRSPADLMADLVPGTDVKGFTLGSEVSGCATDGTQTSVTCTYPISVAAGTPNITALPGVSGEFAYVFRARVSDTTGATNMDAVRGYVTVGGSGGGTTGGTTGAAPQAAQAPRPAARPAEPQAPLQVEQPRVEVQPAVELRVAATKRPRRTSRSNKLLILCRYSLMLEVQKTPTVKSSVMSSISVTVALSLILETRCIREYFRQPILMT